MTTTRRRSIPSPAASLADHARYVVGLLESDPQRRLEIIREARELLAHDARLRPNAIALVRTARELIALGQAIQAQLGEFVARESAEVPA